MNNGFGFRGRTKVCPVCGKEFWCEDPKAWVYRVTSGGQVCTYGCLVRHRKEQERREAERRASAKPAKVRDCMAVSQPKQPINSEKQDTPKRERKKRNMDGYYWLVNLGRIMQDKGVSDRDLAKRTGFNRSTVGQWRRVDTRCADDKIDILAAALGVVRESITENKNGTA